jgi:hypothetical protein
MLQPGDIAEEVAKEMLESFGTDFPKAFKKLTKGQKEDLEDFFRTHIKDALKRVLGLDW